MKKLLFPNRFVLFIIVSVLSFLVFNCNKDEDTTNGDLLYFSFYASREPTYYGEEYGCAFTSFTFDGGGIEKLTDSLTITIDGEKMGRYSNGMYHFEKCGRYNDGDIVKVKISHPKWGDTEFDYLFPDKPDTAYYHPEINEWVKKVGDNITDNDSLRIQFPSTLYCNDFYGFAYINKYPNDTNLSRAEYVNNGLLYKNSPADLDWVNIKNMFLSGKQLIILSSYGWRNTINWGNYCTIRAYCISEQKSEQVYFPANIDGVWDLHANYEAINGLYKVTVSNETDIVQFNQNGSKFTISTHNNIQGNVEGADIYFEGDILPGAGAGGNQTFSGKLDGNIVTGTFYGTVMSQFPGQGAALGSISNSSFTLVKRPN